MKVILNEFIQSTWEEVTLWVSNASELGITVNSLLPSQRFSIPPTAGRNLLKKKKRTEPVVSPSYATACFIA